VPSFHPACIVVAAVILSYPVGAQQPAATAPAQPDLYETLKRLQDIYWDYQSSVPSFFVDEHVVSVMKPEGGREVKTTTDSVFRLVRESKVGEGQTFTESREVRSINKKPAKGDKVQGPSVFTGAFSSAAGVVSLEMQRCFDYTMEPAAELNKAPALLINYAFKPDMLNDDGCPGPEKQSGRAWFDPATLHLLRVEMVVPSHRDPRNGRMLWSWAVDYAPVSFDVKQLWMPKTITSRAEANDASGVWNYTATYTNYHKMTVSSRIITDPQ
jgi:hypothetical protein